MTNLFFFTPGSPSALTVVGLVLINMLLIFLYVAAATFAVTVVLP